MNKLFKIYTQINQINNRNALGYKSTVDFGFGYISALLTNKIITRKEYNILKKVFGHANSNCDFFINKKGKLENYAYQLS